MARTDRFMTLYAIYAKPEKGPDALAFLADRFSWSAFVLPPLWAFSRGALAFVVLWLVVAGALVWAAPVIGFGAASALYGVFALWAGFAAPSIHARALSRRDWIAMGDLVASDAASAERIWLDQIYGARV